MYKFEQVNQIARILELYYDDPTCSWDHYERMADDLYESGCRYVPAEDDVVKYRTVKFKVVKGGRHYGKRVELLRGELVKATREIERLNHEIERLKQQRYIAYPDGRVEMIPTVESVKADTVRDVIIELSAMIGTYQTDSMIRVADVFKMLSIVIKDILED